MARREIDIVIGLLHHMTAVFNDIIQKIIIEEGHNLKSANDRKY